MSHITSLLHRIKTVTTIHRTTSAMRLIAMSIQGRLKRHESVMQRYSSAITQLLQELTDELQPVQPQSAPPQEVQDVAPTAQRPIIIIAGSNKGLCGAFNEHLWLYLQQRLQLIPSDTIIALGKPARDFLAGHRLPAAFAPGPCSVATYHARAQEIITYLMQFPGQEVLFFTQKSKSFFIQQPRTVSFTIPTPAPEHDADPRAALYHEISMMSLKAQITYTLHESLLAEQAARFLSMDNATRNAEKLLQHMKLDYNKLRQAAVTRELIELTSGSNHR